MKFKVGDRVRATQNCSGTREGRVYTVHEDEEGDLYIEDCTCQETWELANRKGKKPNFLLQYELDEDPIEEFETMKEVEERIQELSERNDLKRDSLVIYEIAKKYEVKIETKISKKLIK